MARLYKNMEIFQLSYELAIDIHKMLDKFPEKEKGTIVSQMQRAATSIPLNIAEGSTKKSYREFLQFLTYAYGSAKELDVLLSMSKDLDYLSKKDYALLFSKLDKLMAKLFGFVKNRNPLVNSRLLTQMYTAVFEHAQKSLISDI